VVINVDTIYGHGAPVDVSHNIVVPVVGRGIDCSLREGAEVGNWESSESFC